MTLEQRREELAAQLQSVTQDFAQQVREAKVKELQKESRQANYKVHDWNPDVTGKIGNISSFPDKTIVGDRPLPGEMVVSNPALRLQSLCARCGFTLLQHIDKEADISERPDTASAIASNTARDPGLLTGRDYLVSARSPITGRLTARRQLTARNPPRPEWSDPGAGSGSGTARPGYTTDRSERPPTFRHPPPQCCDDFVIGGGLGPSLENPPNVPTENVKLTSVFAKAYQYAQKDLFPVFERKTPPPRPQRTYIPPE